MDTTAARANDKVSTYLAGLPEWSKTLCTKLRQMVLETDAELVEEWKWGPHYSCQGMVSGWNAFKKHIVLVFFNGANLADTAGLFKNVTDAQFSRSIRIETESDINKPLLQQYIREAIALNKSGSKRTAAPKELAVPEILQTALAKNKKAETFFNNLPYTCKKEYVQWITGAKQEKTTVARIAATVETCAAGLRWDQRPKKTNS